MQSPDIDVLPKVHDFVKYLHYKLWSNLR